MKLKLVLFILSLFFVQLSVAQEDLFNLFEEETAAEKVSATFKTTKVVNGQSVENPAEGELLFIILHRFGRVNQGAYELFGLDQSTIKFAFEYGITDRLALGVGRSSFQKNYDGFIKYRLLEQSKGKKAMPLTVSLLSNMDIKGERWKHPEIENYFSSRMSFTHQILIARKFSERLSLQITPTLVHKNLVPTLEDKNDIFALGAGGRYKITNRLSFNAEYWYLLPDQIMEQRTNTFSAGFDIETGGHVFQLVFSNSRGTYERSFITETVGDWTKGDIYFGFNISRVFTLKD